MTGKPRIAVFSGPTATIQNTPPLRTTGAEPILRAQRLASPAVIYVEAQSAHPLEADARALYAPPDGYLDEHGGFVPLAGAEAPLGRTGVYRVELDPADGPLLLPYVARTASGAPWEGAELMPGAGERQSRQTFYPDASRLYEEIDRFGLDDEGRGQLLARKASFTFVRALPSGGYLSAEGASAAGLAGPERRGADFFGYFPPQLRTEPGAASLARATNTVQATLATGEFLGAQWLEGSPSTEETLYWLNLVLDTTVPIVGHVAQRPHGTLSADGDRNILDGVAYLTSRIWADEEGRDSVGVVMIVDEVIYSSRDVAKTDARPGNYVATGGHGGILGSTGASWGRPVLTYRPTQRHTFASALRLSELPGTVEGVRRDGEGRWHPVAVPVKDSDGMLRPEAMPVVEMLKYGRWADPCCGPSEVDALVAHFAASHALAGIVGEGMSPYAHFGPATDDALRRAVFAGYPVVRCGRANTGGFTPEQPPWFVRGSNLTATKARMLLMACLLRFGAPPPASDPGRPTEAERAATAAAVAQIQEVVDTH